MQLSFFRKCPLFEKTRILPSLIVGGEESLFYFELKHKSEFTEIDKTKKL